MIDNKTNYFIPFSHNTEGYALPERFTFPFHYEPHPLCVLAAKELQDYLTEKQEEWQYHFGFKEGEESVGKMFGVLIVKNREGVLGYLAAFSGKLAGKNDYSHFVPPVFDMLDEEGFYRLGEEEINKINRRIEQLEQDSVFLNLKNTLKNTQEQAEEALKQIKADVKSAKASRDTRRKEAEGHISESEWEILNTQLNKESAEWHYKLKDATRSWKQRLTQLEDEISVFTNKINALKEERKRRSARLQELLFQNYTFLNQYGDTKSLCDIFPISDDILPPSGAGECAAPKLLHHAFKHGYPILAIAEFWWGKSPNSEIRKHRHFYPACKSKCEPILTHILKGIDMDTNPMLRNPAIGKELEIVYEDDFLLVVNKPADFLSVPGKKIDDSVYSRIKNKYPEATGPLIVHRLDMSTSGLLLLAKTKDIHEHLQSQFIKRKIKKRYVAILDGVIEGDEGLIDLPLRVDLDNRPRQLVCYEYGKSAQTEWKVIERKNGYTKVHFSPITGRTHQLRVHASHPLGLNTPIKGDDLYGKRADRLYLHAESLTFMHPHKGDWVTVEAEIDFKLT